MSTFSSLLREPDNTFKILALQQLLQTVDSQWSETAEHISLIEQLSEESTFTERQLASYLCAKIYYHLDNLDEALNYALQSGHHFQPDVNNQFNACLTGHCIDQYIAHQQSRSTRPFPQSKIDLVVKILAASCDRNNHLSAIGIALDCRRIDIVEQILAKWENPQKMIQVLNLINTVQKCDFREKVLRLTVDLLYLEAQQGKITNEEWGLFVTVLVQLGEVSRVAEVLWTLVKDNTFKLQNGSSTVLMAYQLGLDLADNQKPQFIQQLIESLPIDPNYLQQREKLIKILSGEVARKAYLYFLKTHKQTDPHTLTTIKGTTDPKVSVPHGAAIIGHAIAQTGTQDANFLKDNQTWATKCNYWFRFTATSTLGMIHKYNHEESTQLLAQHMLPGANIFEIGGALYGLGLINFSNKNPEILGKFTDQLANLQANEQTLHGASLGIGLTGFASEDQNLSGLLKGLIQKNESVYGEGAAIGLGLLNAGSGSSEVSAELLKLANQTDKDKIVRSLTLAIASVNFHQEDKADILIEQMLKDNNPFIRYGGCFTLALAYVGTASNKVIQRLLQVAVEDVSDDVRRAAVICFGFILFKNYESVPKVMRLLILSYNPHIRYGTAIALGIACAGTMYSEAISMLQPMLADNVDFVRQGALIALGLILSHANVAMEPKFEAIQKSIQEIQSKKHETVLVKLGLLTYQGLSEAGGRNMIVSLQSRQGFPKLDAVVGMMYFVNHWFWFPCLSMISLVLQPAALIGLNENLDIPRDFQVQCNTKQSVFNYPALVKADEKKVIEKKTVKLSTTNRVKARQIRKDQEVEMGGSIGPALSHGESKVSLDPQQSGLIKNQSCIIEEPQVVEEPQLYILSNPCRILERQKKHIQLLEGDRFCPLLKDRKQGIIILVDTNPGQFADAIALYPVQGNGAAGIPEAFVFDEAEQNMQ